MRRRTILTTLGASALPLAGCLGTAAPGTDHEPRSSTEKGQPTSLPSIAVRSEDEQPPTASVTVSVERQFSATRPAKIEITYTNTAESSRKIDFQASPPFSEYVSTGQAPPNLAIIPDDHSHMAPVRESKQDSETGSLTVRKSIDTDSTDERSLVPETPVEGCWATNGFSVYGVAHPKTLEPGESVAEEYVVLGQSADSTCLPSGSARFEQAGYFEDGQSWGFTIELE